jgi:putative tryptophan/tyrosine transport system substrate-binding protein
MRRRAIIFGLLAAPWAMRARGEVQRRISILHSGFPRRTLIHLLFDDLRALGYGEGSGTTIELYGAEGDADRLTEIVARLVAQPPDVILALTSPAVLALKRAGVTTPVVFGFVGDPVALGIVRSLARPGGNFTGVTSSDAALGGKRLELLVDTLPGTRRIAVIWSRSFAESAAILDSIRKSASARDIEIDARELHGVEDLAAAFTDAKAAGAQALIFQTDNLLYGHRKEVAELALIHRLPSIHSFEAEARDGGLMSYGAEGRETYRRTAALVDRVLKGARPTDLPVEEPTRFQLVVNLRTAAVLGLAIPSSIIARADEVIE